MDAHGPTTPHRDLAVELPLLGLLALLWGSSYLFVKVAVATVPPVTLIASRVGIAALVLLLVVRLQHAALPRDAATWRSLFVLSFLNGIGAWTLLAWGQQFVDSGLAGVLNSTAPIFIVAITMLGAGGVAVRKAVGAALGIAGVVMIVGLEVLDGLGDAVLGQAAVLGGAAMYACAGLYGTRFNHLPPTVTAAGTMLCATAVLVPASLVVDRPWTLAPSATSLAAALALSVLCTAGALLLYYRLLRTLGPLGVASQAYLRAGVSVLLGMAILGETVSPTLGVGLGLVLLGVAAINSRRGTGAPTAR